MRHLGSLLLTAALAAGCTSAQPRVAAVGAGCPPVYSAALAELGVAMADTARLAEVRRLTAHTGVAAELRWALADTAQTAEFRRRVADTAWVAWLRPRVAELQAETARLSRCWSD